jgi:hypothetical protein
MVQEKTVLLGITAATVDSMKSYGENTLAL